MARFYAWMIGLVTGLQALGVFALAQDAFIPATVNPPGPPPVYRLSLEEAQRIAWPTTPALLGTTRRAGEVNRGRCREEGLSPETPRELQLFPFQRQPGESRNLPYRPVRHLASGDPHICSQCRNQDSTLTAITLAQPITKLIAVNAAVQLARADTLIAQAQLDKGT